jgi:hypothetical protein
MMNSAYSTEIIEWIDEVQMLSRRNAQTMTVDVTEDTSVFFKTSGQALYLGEPLQYPYLRLAVAKYIHEREQCTQR